MMPSIIGFIHKQEAHYDHPTVRITVCIWSAHKHIHTCCKSELLKLQRRSLTTTSVTFTVLFVVTPIIFLLTVWKQGIKEPISATSITSGLQLFVLFSIIIGTLAVTSEYASNTMRTSCLAVPQRLKNLLAKCSAVAIYTSGVTAGDHHSSFRYSRLALRRAYPHHRNGSRNFSTLYPRHGTDRSHGHRYRLLGAVYCWRHQLHGVVYFPSPARLINVSTV